MDKVKGVNARDIWHDIDKCTLTTNLSKFLRPLANLEFKYFGSIYYKDRLLLRIRTPYKDTFTHIHASFSGNFNPLLSPIYIVAKSSLTKIGNVQVGQSTLLSSSATMYL